MLHFLSLKLSHPIPVEFYRFIMPTRWVGIFLSWHMGFMGRLRISGESLLACAHDLESYDPPIFYNSSDLLIHGTNPPNNGESSHKVLSFDIWAQKLCDICSPISNDLDFHTMLPSASLLCDRQAHRSIMTASITKSKGQALKVSLVKPVAYLSKSY